MRYEVTIKLEIDVLSSQSVQEIVSKQVKDEYYITDVRLLDRRKRAPRLSKTAKPAMPSE